MEYVVAGVVLFYIGGIVWMIAGIYIDDFVHKWWNRGKPWHQRRK